MAGTASQADPLNAIAALPGVFEAVEAARGGVDALLRDLAGPELRRRGAEVSTESLRRGGWASAVLDGAETPLEDFHAPFPPGPSAALAAGALRVTTGLGPLVSGWGRAPLQALARLHTLAAADLLPEPELGRPRADPEISARLAALAELVVAPTSASAVVLAAVVHGELLALQPFSWGTGLVARAAARLVLLSRGVDPRAVTVPEEGHLELGRDAYRAAGSAYASLGPDGVAAWVVHCSQALAVGARVGRAVATQVAGAD